MGQGMSNLNPVELQDLKEITHYSRHEIKSWHRDFMKSFPSGILTRYEFQCAYAQQFPYSDSSLFSAHVFRTFDKDRNNMVNFREFVTGMSMTTSDDLKDKLRWAFAMYDSDRSGGITQYEMLEILQALYKMVGCFKDTSKDILTPEEIAEEVFPHLDKNRDGRISMEEFVEGARRSSFIVNLLHVNELSMYSS